MDYSNLSELICGSPCCYSNRNPQICKSRPREKWFSTLIGSNMFCFGSVIIQGLESSGGKLVIY